MTAGWHLGTMPRFALFSGFINAAFESAYPLSFVPRRAIALGELGQSFKSYKRKCLPAATNKILRKPHNVAHLEGNLNIVSLSLVKGIIDDVMCLFESHYGLPLVAHTPPPAEHSFN